MRAAKRLRLSRLTQTETFGYPCPLGNTCYVLRRPDLTRGHRNRRLSSPQKALRRSRLFLTAGSAEPEPVHWQLENLTGTIRVLQLNCPVWDMYRVENQNVQSSVGSMLMLA